MKTVQYQHLHIRIASGFFTLYNVYATFQTYSLPNFQNYDTMCMGNSNARHTAFGENQCNENDEKLRHFVNNRSMSIRYRQGNLCSGGRLNDVMK